MSEKLYNCEVENEFPSPMPGQECGKHWFYVWKCITSIRSFDIQDENESVNFNVGPLLQITTGLDVQHLAMIVKARGKRAKNKKETAEILSEEAYGYVFPLGDNMECAAKSACEKKER